MPLGVSSTDQNMDAQPRKRKTHVKLLIQWSLRLILIGFIVYWVQTDTAQDAFEKLATISASSLAVMGLLSLLLMLVSALRWSHLIQAFGNPAQPILLLLKLSLVGHFYNTFVPGAVGGDVLRAAVSAQFYAKKNTSYLVVFMERLLGLSCLCVILSFGVFSQPETSSNTILIVAGVGIVGILILVLVLFNWQKLLGFASTYLDGITQRTRVVHALFLSILGQCMTLLLFAFICQQFEITLSFAAYCFIFPLGLLASVLPISILGAGAREFALISLLMSQGGVLNVDAIGVSTAYLGCLWFLGIVGGVIHLTSKALVPTIIDSDTTRSSE